jgi:hypothetical protein
LIFDLICSKLDSVMGMVGLGPRREPTLMDEFNEATTLSYKNVRSFCLHARTHAQHLLGQIAL